MWDLANEYLGWFAVTCHYTPDQVYDMPWTALITLTMVADSQRNSQPSPTHDEPMQRMC